MKCIKLDQVEGWGQGMQTSEALYATEPFTCGWRLAMRELRMAAMGRRAI